MPSFVDWSYLEQRMNERYKHQEKEQMNTTEYLTYKQYKAIDGATIYSLTYPDGSTVTLPAAQHGSSEVITYPRKKEKQYKGIRMRRGV